MKQPDQGTGIAIHVGIRGREGHELAQADPDCTPRGQCMEGPHRGAVETSDRPIRTAGRT